MHKGVMKAYAAERWLYLHHFRMIPKFIHLFFLPTFNPPLPYPRYIGGCLPFSTWRFRSCIA